MRPCIISRIVPHSPDKFSALISVHARCMQLLKGSILVLRAHVLASQERRSIQESEKYSELLTDKRQWRELAHGPCSRGHEFHLSNAADRDKSQE